MITSCIIVLEKKLFQVSATQGGWRRISVVWTNTVQWAGSGGTRKQEASGWLHCYHLLAWICLEIKKLSCKDKIKTNYSRKLTAVVWTTTGALTLFLSSSYPGTFLCPISDTYLGFPMPRELCIGWLDHQSCLKYMPIISSKQWFKKCQDIWHLHGDQWHAWMLDNSPKEVGAPTSTFSFTERRLVVSSSPGPLEFCESLAAQSHGKASHLI